MAVLKKVSTRLATKFALYLFFKPLPFPRPEREKAMVRNSKVKDLFTKRQSPFRTYRTGQGPKRILMVHGWSGRGTQFFKIAAALEQEFEIVAIDAPGHGPFQGKRTHMLEFVDAVEATIAHYGTFEFALGHSLGGMALFNALKEGHSFEKMAIMGSPSGIAAVVHDFCEKVKAGEKVAHSIIAYIEKRYQMKVADASTVPLAQKFNPPGMIFHDEQDQDVPIRHAIEVDKAWKAAPLIRTQGLGHRKILMDETVIEQLYDFFKN